MAGLAWYVTIILVTAIAVAFLIIARNAGKARDYASVQPAAYRWRARAFWSVVVLGVVVAGASLRELPYLRADAQPPAQVVNATGHQWYWDLDRDTVVAGQPVEFRVAAEDVNHGFGIYDSDNRMLAQVQAMPGYVNRLQHIFEQPGTYRLLCLEYCGLAHHEMIAELEVTAP